jgi:hypothetical protein
VVPDGFILFRHSGWVNCLTTSVKRRYPVLSKVQPLQTALMEKAAMQIEENLLQAEIEFWRYLIQSRRGTISEQATERMLLACELAERKLMMMDGTGCRMETRQ